MPEPVRLRFMLNPTGHFPVGGVRPVVFSGSIAEHLAGVVHEASPA